MAMHAYNLTPFTLPAGLPTERSTIVEPQNPLIDVS